MRMYWRIGFSPKMRKHKFERRLLFFRKRVFFEKNTKKNFFMRKKYTFFKNKLKWFYLICFFMCNPMPHSGLIPHSRRQCFISCAPPCPIQCLRYDSIARMGSFEGGNANFCTNRAWGYKINIKVRWKRAQSSRTFFSSKCETCI